MRTQMAVLGFAQLAVVAFSYCGCSIGHHVIVSKPPAHPPPARVPVPAPEPDSPVQRKVKLLYRFNDVSTTIYTAIKRLGYEPMIEIPPKVFLDRKSQPWNPDIELLLQSASSKLRNPANFSGYIQGDYENFQELNGDSAAISFSRRHKVITALKSEYPNAKIGAYGVVRLVGGKTNAYMAQLVADIDYISVVCYRRGKDKPSTRSIERFKSNLTYAKKFNKPVVVVISPMWFDSNKNQRLLKPADHEATLSAIRQFGTNIEAVYVWSNAYSMLDSIVPAISRTELTTYNLEFLKRTKSLVEEWNN